MASRNFIHSYLYGNANKQDFTEANLPENRFQLFWQVLNNRKGKMLGLNLLYLLFWLPSIAWTILNALQIDHASAMAPEDFWVTFLQIAYTWLVFLFPLIAITGPFNVGMSYVFHRWAQDDHSDPYSDFWTSVKDNWKQGLLFGIVEGFLPLLVFLAARFYIGLAAESSFYILLLVLLLIVMLLWALAAPLMPQLIASYKLHFIGHMQNALLMTIVSLPRSFAVRLATCAIPILILLGVFFLPSFANWLLPIGILLYSVFMLSFNKLIWASYANALGEKYLNVHIQGARTDIGLRPKRENESSH